MKKDAVRFTMQGEDVFVHGFTPLEGRKGHMLTDVVASFRGDGWDNHEWYIANINTGRVRQLSTNGGMVLVEDSDIDYEAIYKQCEHGAKNAERKVLNYGSLGTWDGFKEGFCAISWTLYPDGRYFADSDGYGMEDNDEENVYGIINENLDFVFPFQPIQDIRELLQQLRKQHKQTSTLQTMKTRIFNLIILDESGSMMSIKKEAMDSVNETVQTIRAAQKKHTDQEHYVSLVTFNNDSKTVYECVGVDEVKELNAETYQPNCCTALYDAMGESLSALRKKVAADDKVLVTVVTDGCENASSEYSGQAIKALVDELKQCGWVFAYIGANHDVEAVAATISITNVMQFHADSVGTKMMSQTTNDARTRMYDRIAENCFCAAVENENFFEKP